MNSKEINTITIAHKSKHKKTWKRVLTYVFLIFVGFFMILYP